jgi:hypothetical protein
MSTECVLWHQIITTLTPSLWWVPWVQCCLLSKLFSKHFLGVAIWMTMERVQMTVDCSLLPRPSTSSTLHPMEMDHMFLPLSHDSSPLCHYLWTWSWGFGEWEQMGICVTYQTRARVSNGTQKRVSASIILCPVSWRGHIPDRVYSFNLGPREQTRVGHILTWYLV